MEFSIGVTLSLAVTGGAGFCLAFDVIAGGYLAVLSRRRSRVSST